MGQNAKRNNKGISTARTHYGKNGETTARMNATRKTNQESARDMKNEEKKKRKA